MARRKGLPRNQSSQPLVLTMEKDQSCLTTDSSGTIFVCHGDLTSIAILILEHAYKRRKVWTGILGSDVYFSRFHFHWDELKNTLLIEPRYPDETNPAVFELIDKMSRTDSLKAFL